MENLKKREGKEPMMEENSNQRTMKKNFSGTKMSDQLRCHLNKHILNEGRDECLKEWRSLGNEGGGGGMGPKCQIEGNPFIEEI
jgi:hypothetical protein